MKFQDVNTGRTKSDEYYTPPNALEPLLDLIPRNKTIWEPTDTSGHISNFFIERGYTVLSSSDDFFSHTVSPGDVIVTNPPYSKKTQFLQRCYELGKPFALLMPITALEGSQRQDLYKLYGIKLILFNKRISFIESKSGPWFATAWFCHRLPLPRQLNFVDV